MINLQPSRPPGRSDRKVAAYVPEILRLRAAGFTYEAIREALAEVDVTVSTTSLRREVQRHQRLSPSPAASDTFAGQRSPATSSERLAQAQVPAQSAALSGHQIAEAFFDAHPSNPLFRTKEDP